MQNFGRGMWRRVGDFERIHTPQINKQQQLQHYLALLEYKQKKQLLNDYYQETNKLNSKSAKN